MSSDMIKITDTCTCGAVFSIDGYNDYARNHHSTWLDAHNVCRHKDTSKQLIKRN